MAQPQTRAMSDVHPLQQTQSHLTSRRIIKLSKRTGAGLGLTSAGSSMMASCIAQYSMKISGWCSCSMRSKTSSMHPHLCAKRAVAWCTAVSTLLVPSISCMRSRLPPAGSHPSTRPSHHVNFGDVQARHQGGHWLLHRLLPLLHCACLMLQVLRQKLFKIVQLEGAGLAKTSCKWPWTG